MPLQFLFSWLNKPAWAEKGPRTEKTASTEEGEFIRRLLENFQLPEDDRAEFARSLRKLTHRQRQVLILLCHGYTHRLIAEQLEISPQSVRNHTRMIYLKLGLSSCGEVQAAMLGLALSNLGRRVL